jgi:excisionase family DNA binding protein
MKHLLPLSRLAARLRLPADWLREEALAGRIPCLRVGRKLLFNADAVEKALAERAGREVVAVAAS